MKQTLKSTRALTKNKTVEGVKGSALGDLDIHKRMLTGPERHCLQVYLLWFIIALETKSI